MPTKRKTKARTKAKAKATPPNPLPQTITFNYIKSNMFRVLHVDGVYGGISANGLHMTLFNERPAIPQQIVCEVTPTGTLGNEVSELRVARDGIVREVEVEALLSIHVAKALHKWLSSHIKQWDRINRSAEGAEQ